MADRWEGFRCEVCGRGRHRYCFPADGLAAGGRDHQPSAVACANGIIHLVERSLSLRGRKRQAVLEEAFDAVTDMAFEIDRLRPDTQDSETAPKSGDMK